MWLVQLPYYRPSCRIPQISIWPQLTDAFNTCTVLANLEYYLTENFQTRIGLNSLFIRTPHSRMTLGTGNRHKGTLLLCLEDLSLGNLASKTRLPHHRPKQNCSP